MIYFGFAVERHSAYSIPIHLQTAVSDLIGPCQHCAHVTNSYGWVLNATTPLRVYNLLFFSFAG